MFKYLFLIIVLFLLGSCAQTFSIEGGPVDKTPPQPVKNGIHPANESLNFTEKTIKMKFNEFIQLNNPLQTISISPADIQVKAESKGKELILKIDGEPRPQTTYVITLNGTVKDFTEGNDSLMQYVFSTGDFIDSLTYSGYVIDAKEHQVVSNCFVGLYNLNDSAIYERPQYFATTDKDGFFNFKYLQPGTFQLFAFTDQNRDGKWQITEKVAFTENLITVDTAQKDTLNLMLFQPELPQKLSASVTYPAKMTITGRNAIQLEKLTLNNQEIAKDQIVWYQPDSLSFVFDSISDQSYQVAITHYQDSLKTDTINVRPPISNRRKPLKPTFEFLKKSTQVQAGDTIQFRFTDKIAKVDTSKMELISNDSLALPFTAFFSDEYFSLVLDSIGQKLVNFNVLKGGILFQNNQDSLTFTRLFQILDEATIGSLSLDMKKLPDNAVVEMWSDKELYQTFILSETGKQIRFNQLKAGSYTFKAFIDENGDGRWTTGGFALKRQPEKIIRFKDAINIRPNWDIEAELEPLDDEK